MSATGESVQPAPKPTAEERLAALEARVEAQAKEIVLLRARCTRAEMTSDGVINFLANSTPR